MEKRFDGGKIETIQGDITREAMDAIVNAANKSLLGGGGVDGAIHRTGGPAILEECRRLGGCDTGEAKMTTAGNLPAKYVIHTVGPVYQDGAHGEPEQLAQCHRRVMQIANEHSFETLAFPAISCGVYGYPVEDAARIALGAVAEEIADGGSVNHVRFVLFSQDVHETFERVLMAL